MPLILPQELYSSKNSHQIWKNKKTGKPFVQKSDRALQSFENMCLFLQDAKRKRVWKAMTTGKDYPLTVQFKIYRKTHRRFDYMNIVQNLCDALVKSDYLPDDSMQYLIPAFVPYEKDKENPRVEITVL